MLAWLLLPGHDRVTKRPWRPSSPRTTAPLGPWRSWRPMAWQHGCGKGCPVTQFRGIEGRVISYSLVYARGVRLAHPPGGLVHRVG